MKELIELNLPEWAFLDAHSHLGNPLGNRTLILHVRSATVIEIFDLDYDKFNLKEGVLSFKFNNIGVRKERLIAVVHYCAKLNIRADAEYIIENILKPCAQWYCLYCDWEDKNVLDSEL